MSRPDAPPLDALRKRAVFAALDEVMDPELDQSVAAMGFVHRIDLDDTPNGTTIAVEFRLPTFWCSANFAFLMAEDMRIALERLDWIKKAEIRLVDHFAASAINRGVAEGLSFKEVFSEEAREDLAHLRRTFRQKAFLSRQEALLRPLARARGAEAALALTVTDLTALCDCADSDLALAARRYLAARRHDGGLAGAEEPAFTDLDGMPVTPAGYVAHLRDIRRVRGASEANAEMCRIYLQARYAEETSIETQEKKREMSA